MMTTRVRTALLLAATAATTCARPSGPGPDVHLAASPRYPCQGDAVTLTFTSTAVDRIEIRDARGQVVGEAKGPRGVVSIPHIDRSMLPLVARAWSGDASSDARMPGEVPLGVIAASSPTELFPLEERATGPEQRTKIGTQDCGCTFDDDGAPLICEKAAPIYDVRVPREGGTAQLDAALFSPRAHVVGVTNGTPYDLTYFHGSNRIAVVPHGESREIDFASEVVPGGTWTGKFDASQQAVDYAGTFVEGGQVCKGWVHRASPPPLPEPRVALGFTLRCME
jgi:hypothetical protein